MEDPTCMPPPRMSIVAAAASDADAESANASIPAAISAPRGEAENIAVCIRVRPMSERERRHKDVNVLRTVSAMNLISITDLDGAPLPGKQNVFQYDHIFDDAASTRVMYDRVAKRIVRSTLDGINGTIFAYGQTSSGKTYTMTGTDTTSDGTSALLDSQSHRPEPTPGILQLAVEDIFAFIEQSPDRDFLLRVSFVEIYNEVVKDLLTTSESGNNLKLREDPRKGVYVECKEEIITNYESILQLLELGTHRRTVGQTAMNEKSSRSHSIFRIVIESKEKSTRSRRSEDDMNGAVLVGCLSLVDLAGSESLRHTGAEGMRQREAGNINKSLLTLSRVINSLSNSAAGAQNAPFRDSKLTRLLQNSLDGNTRTLIICCVTPADRYLEETKSTLQFAARAKTIQTSAQVNEVLDDQAQLKRLKREVHDLKKLVNAEAYNALKAENEALQHEKSKNQVEIQRLLGLVLSSSSVRSQDDKRVRTKPRSKRSRETWCPGDFAANMPTRHQFDAAEAFTSPLVKKRHTESKWLLDSKENQTPPSCSTASDAQAPETESSCTPGKYGTDGALAADLKDILTSLEARLRRRQECVNADIMDDVYDDDVGTRVHRIAQEIDELVEARIRSDATMGETEVLKMAVEELQNRLHEAKCGTPARAPQEPSEARDSVQVDLERLQEQLQLAHAERDQAMARLLVLQEANREHDNSIAENAKTEVEQLREQLDHALADLQATKDARDEQLCKMTEDLASKSESLERATAEFGIREAQLLQQIESLKLGDDEHSRNVESENDAAHRENARLCEALSAMEEQLEQNASHRRELEAQIIQLQEDKMVLEDKLAEEGCADGVTSSISTDFHDKFQQMQDRVHELEQELDVSAQTAASLQSRLENADKSVAMKTVLEEKETEIRRLQLSLEEATAYKDFVQNEMDELCQQQVLEEEEQIALKAENEQLRRQAAALKSELEKALSQQLGIPDELMVKIDELQERMEELQNELEAKSICEKELHAELRQASQLLQEKDDRLERLKSENGCLIETTRMLDEEKATWLHKCASEEDLHAEITNLRQERWSLFTKLQESEELLVRERNEFQRMAAELSAVEADKTQLAEKDAELTSFKTGCSEKDEALESNRKIIAELECQLAAKNAEIQQLAAQVDSSQTIDDGKVAHEGEDRRAMLEVQVRELEERLNTTEKEKSDLLDELTALESQLMAVSEEKLSLQAAVDARHEKPEASPANRSEADEQVSLVCAERDAYRLELETAINRNKTLQRQCDEMEMSLASLQVEMSKTKEVQAATVEEDLPTDVGELTLRVQSEVQRRAKLELDVRSYVEALEMMRQESQDRSQALKTAQASLEEQTMARNNLDSELRQVRTALKQAKEEQEELRFQIKERLLSVGGSGAASTQHSAAMEEELRNVKAQASRQEAMSKQLLVDATQRLEAMQTQIDTLTHEKRAFQERAEELQQSVACDQEQTRRAADSLDQVHAMQLQLDALQNDKTALQEQVDHLREASAASTSELSKLQRDMDQAIDDKMQAEDALKQLTITGKERESELQRSASMEVSRLRGRLEQTERDMAELQRKTNDEIHKLHELVEQYETDKLEMDRLARRREEALRQDVMEREESIVAMQASMEKLRLQATDAMAQAEAIQEDKESSAAVVEELRVALENAQMKCEEIESEHAAQVKDLSAKIEALECTVHEQRSQQEEFADALKSTQREAVHYHTQLVAEQLAKDQMEQVVAAQKSRIDKLEKVKMTTDTLELFRKLKRERDEFHAQVLTLQEQVEALGRAKEQSREIAEQQRHQVVQLKEEEIALLKSHMHELEELLEEQKERTADIEREMRAAVEELQSHVQQQVDEMQRLQAKLDQGDKERDALVEKQRVDEAFLSKENLQLIVENRKLKERLASRSAAHPVDSTNTLSLHLDDDDAAVHASIQAAHALLAEPPMCAPTRRPRDEDSEHRPAATDRSTGETDQRADIQRPAASSVIASASEPSTEEAKPACIQQ